MARGLRKQFRSPSRERLRSPLALLKRPTNRNDSVSRGTLNFAVTSFHSTNVFRVALSSSFLLRLLLRLSSSDPNPISEENPNRIRKAWDFFHRRKWRRLRFWSAKKIFIPFPSLMIERVYFFFPLRSFFFPPLFCIVWWIVVCSFAHIFVFGSKTTRPTIYFWVGSCSDVWFLLLWFAESSFISFDGIGFLVFCVFFFLMFVQILLNYGRDLGGDKLTPKFVMECVIGFIFLFEVRLDVSAFGSASCFTWNLGWKKEAFFFLFTQFLWLEMATIVWGFLNRVHQLVGMKK